MLDNTNSDNEKYIIFASDDSDLNTIEFLEARKIGYKQLQGKYKGEEETSFIINKKDYPVCQVLTENQESILEISPIENNGLRKGRLIYNNGDYTTAEYIKPVTKDIAEQSEGFTFDPSTNTYFVIGV